MRHFRISNLQWGAGILSAFIGTLLLISPHRFTSLQEWFILKDSLVAFGYALLISGCVLLSIPIMAPSSQVITLTHLVTSGLLGFFALSLLKSFQPGLGWIIPLNLIMIVLGLLIALVIPQTYQTIQPQRDAKGYPLKGDFFTFLLGNSTLLVGLGLIAQSLIYPDWVILGGRKLFTGLFALLLILAGLTLTAVQLAGIRRFTRARKLWVPLMWGSHLFAGAVFLIALLLPNDNRLITTFYAGFAFFLLTVSWVSPKMAHHSPLSMESRLALVLALVVGLPLILSINWMSYQEEKSVLQETLINQENQARALAADIRDYISLHGSVLKGIAGQPYLLSLSQSSQQEELNTYLSAYPDVSAFSIFNKDGQPLSSTNENMKYVSAKGSPFYELARQTRQSALDVIISPVFRKPVLELSQPILSADGTFQGIVALAMPIDRISTQLQESSLESNIHFFLVDQNGRVITHPDMNLVNSFADLSNLPVVQAFKTNPNIAGNLIYDGLHGRELAGYARVANYGWGVIVERQSDDALEGVYYRRDLAVGFLIFVLPLSALLGMILSARLAAPLQALSQAAFEMAQGNDQAPLPATKFVELARLSRAFGEMRLQLAKRTEEREYALAALRTSNETLEKRVEQRTAEIDAERARLKAVIDAAPEGIMVIDQQTRILFMNPTAAKLFDQDIPIGELYKSQTNLRLCQPGGILIDPKELPLTRSALFGETYTKYEMALRKPDKQVRSLLVNTAPIYDKHQSITGAVGVYQDITERKRLEDENNLQRQLLQNIFEGDPEGIAVIVQHEHGAFVELCNPAYQELTPTPDVSPMGKYYEEVWPNELGKSSSEWLKNVLTERVSLSIDKAEQNYPDGTRRYFTIHFRPLDWTGRTAALLVIWDITSLEFAKQQARLAAEYAKRRAQEAEASKEILREYTAKLERSNQDLQDFAFIASHDLMEPLRKVQAFGERLKSKYDEQLPEEASDWINRMQNAAFRMQTMLNDLLTYSRVSTRAQPYVMVNLNEIVEQVIADLEVRIEKTHGVVNYDRLPCVEADPSQLNQLLLNLISNALKFHKPDVPPVIYLRSKQADPGWVEFEVEDNGIGIDIDNHAKIFEPFQRLHGRSEYEGNGMGLAICRKIIERHKGIIRVQSALGQGTTFIIRLPEVQHKEL